MLTRFRDPHRAAIAGLLALGLLTTPVVSVDAASSVVKAVIWDKPDGSQGIDLSTNSVKAGKITFVATNKTVSQQEQEFLVVKTELKSDQLPFTEADARVDEEKLGNINEIGDIQPGKSKKATFDLTPGKYLLFCNEEGHVKAGMITSFTVEP
jgi:uncharacterized cupredoxin-like copper-binding protein